MRFTGYVAPGDLPGCTRARTCWRWSSTYEPFGVAAREAAAAGLPIVCARTAGAAGDIAVEGENAILVDPAGRDEIGAALAPAGARRHLPAQLAEGPRRNERNPPEADAEAFERAVLRWAA